MFGGGSWRVVLQWCNRFSHYGQPFELAGVSPASVTWKTRTRKQLMLPCQVSLCVPAHTQSSSSPSWWKNSFKDIHNVQMSLCPCEVEVHSVHKSGCTARQVNLESDHRLRSKNLLSDWIRCEIKVDVLHRMSLTHVFSVLSSFFCSPNWSYTMQDLRRQIIRYPLRSHYVWGM